MSFQRTKKIIKKIPILPIFSYLSADLFLGFILKEIANLGNWGYIIAAIILPLFINACDWFSNKQLTKALIDDWKELPKSAHVLIIIDSIILSNLIETIKTKDLLWITKHSNKQQ